MELVSISFACHSDLLQPKQNPYLHVNAPCTWEVELLLFVRRAIPIVRRTHCLNVRLQEIYPGQFEPSIAHKFVRLIETHCKLLRNYTQNIDTLEQVAHIDRVIQCHGEYTEHL